MWKDNLRDLENFDKKRETKRNLCLDEQRENFIINYSYNLEISIIWGTSIIEKFEGFNLIYFCGEDHPFKFICTKTYRPLEYMKLIYSSRKKYYIPSHLTCD